MKCKWPALEILSNRMPRPACNDSVLRDQMRLGPFLPCVPALSWRRFPRSAPFQAHPSAAHPLLFQVCNFAVLPPDGKGATSVANILSEWIPNLAAVAGIAGDMDLPILVSAGSDASGHWAFDGAAPGSALAGVAGAHLLLGNSGETCSSRVPAGLRCAPAALPANRRHPCRGRPPAAATTPLVGPADLPATLAAAPARVCKLKCYTAQNRTNRLSRSASGPASSGECRRDAPRAGWAGVAYACLLLVREREGDSLLCRRLFCWSRHALRTPPAALPYLSVKVSAVTLLPKDAAAPPPPPPD